MRIYVEVITGRHDGKEVFMRKQVLDVPSAKDMVADLGVTFDCDHRGMGFNDLGEPVVVRHVMYMDKSQVKEGVFVI